MTVEPGAGAAARSAKSVAPFFGAGAQAAGGRAWTLAWTAPSTKCNNRQGRSLPRPPLLNVKNHILGTAVDLRPGVAAVCVRCVAGAGGRWGRQPVSGWGRQ